MYVRLTGESWMAPNPNPDIMSTLKSPEHYPHNY